MTDSPFEITPRKRLTSQQKARLFLERDGKCHRCERKLSPGDKWIVEHLTALENGGTNDWDNLSITCDWCKPEKDREDHGIAAKARHVATKHVGAHVPKSPPMPGTKRSGWKKKINGEVVRR